MKKLVIFIIMCIIILAGCLAAAGVFSGLGFESTVVSLHVDASQETVLSIANAVAALV